MRVRKGLIVKLLESKQGLHMIARLYDTIILIRECGYVKLNSGGWRTNHTKNCMNDLLPQGYSVYRKGTWFVRTPNGDLPFTDGMILNIN